MHPSAAAQQGTRAIAANPVYAGSPRPLKKWNPLALGYPPAFSLYAAEYPSASAGLVKVQQAFRRLLAIFQSSSGFIEQVDKLSLTIT